ncbi:Etoposide-induced protein 2.4 protein [Schistosoma japonicum]|nr:Etoposide-induced protein 2.4 protein [Schistosoma japonicum]
MNFSDNLRETIINKEFLTTPIRLWRMHYHLTQFMSSYVHNTKIHEHQRERQKRLEIRIPSSDRLTISWFESSRFCQFVQRLFSCSVHVALLLFMELVNLLYLKKICDRITLLSMTKEYRYIQRSSILFTGFSNLSSIDRSNYFLNSAIGGTIMDRLYTLIFFIIFQLQWNLLATLSANYCIGNVINAFSVAFLYACYAFEYRWRQVTGTTFEGFLGRIVDNWTYFLGYGLPLGCASIIFPHFIGWGGVILAIGYPVLVIGALGSRWRPFDVSINVKDEWKVFRLLRYCLIISLRPALWVSNLVVQTSAWFVYQFLFRQNYSVGSNHDEDENNTGISRGSSIRRRQF